MSAIRQLSQVYLGFLLFSLASLNSIAAPVNFAGNLDIINEDNGGALFSETPLGTAFSGVIDDANFTGSVTSGGLTAEFDCCIAAGGLDVANNVTFGQEDADLINQLLTVTGNAQYAKFTAGAMFDAINIEGDALTETGSRIEVGVSYLLTANAIETSGGNPYPFDPQKLVFSNFFVIEEGSGADYDILGLIEVGPAIALPIPAAAWLFPTGLIAGLGWMRRRRST